jgi:hypothetical protein
MFIIVIFGKAIYLPTILKILTNRERMMDFKRFFGAALAVFVFIFVFEWLIHGVLLMGEYRETQSLWRDFSDKPVNMFLHIFYQLIFAIWVTFVFTQIFPLGGLWDGLRFGIYFGVFAGLLTGMWYIHLPVSASLGWSWFATSLVEGIGTGIILGVSYKRVYS